MLKPSFEMSNFVAVSTSTIVRETHYNEVFEMTCRVQVSGVLLRFKISRLF